MQEWHGDNMVFWRHGGLEWWGEGRGGSRKLLLNTLAHNSSRKGETEERRSSIRGGGVPTLKGL